MVQGGVRSGLQRSLSLEIPNKDSCQFKKINWLFFAELFFHQIYGLWMGPASFNFCSAFSESKVNSAMLRVREFERLETVFSESK